jgi:hypothetical protein
MEQEAYPDTMCIYLRATPMPGTGLRDTLVGPFRAVARFAIQDSITASITVPH